MHKTYRTISVLVLVALTALVLVACGDATATPAPAATTASGGSATTASSGGSATTSGGGSATTASGGAATTAASSGGAFYKVGNASATDIPSVLQSSLAAYNSQYPGYKAQAFKTSDSSANVKSALTSAFTGQGWTNQTAGIPDTPGGFSLVFTKGSQGAAVVAFPGTVAGLGTSDLIYIVFVP